MPDQEPGPDDDDVDPTLVLALDPATPPETLRALADNPGLHLFLALHPRADEELLTHLAAQDDPAVSAALEQRAVRAPAVADDDDPGDAADDDAPSPSSISPPTPSRLARFLRSGRGRLVVLGVVALVAVAAIVLPMLRPSPTFADGGEIAWQKSVEDILGVSGQIDPGSTALVGDWLVIGATQLEGRAGDAAQATIGLDARTGATRWEREGRLSCANDGWWQWGRPTGTQLACIETVPSGDSPPALLLLDPATGRVLSETPLPAHGELVEGDGHATRPAFTHASVIDWADAIVVTSVDERGGPSVATVLSLDGEIVNGAVRLAENEWVNGVAADGSLLLVTQEFDDTGTVDVSARLLDPAGETVLELFAQYEGYSEAGASAVLLPDGTVIHSPAFDVTEVAEGALGGSGDKGPGPRLVVAQEPGWLGVDPETGEVILVDEAGSYVVDPATGEVAPRDLGGSEIDVDGQTGFVQVDGMEVVVVAEDGEELARHSLGTDGWNLAFGAAVLSIRSSSSDVNVRAIDPVSGDVIWELLEAPGWVAALTEESLVFSNGSEITVIRPSATSEPA
ncbi:variant leucine-rich repeat-containing protein [Salana multivorans]